MRLVKRPLVVIAAASALALGTAGVAAAHQGGCNRAGTYPGSGTYPGETSGTYPGQTTTKKSVAARKRERARSISKTTSRPSRGPVT